MNNNRQTYESTPCKHCGCTTRYHYSRHCVNRHRHDSELERYKNRFPVAEVVADGAGKKKKTASKANTYNGAAPPCDGCDRRNVCASQLLACKQLVTWTREGKAAGERYPNHFLYRQHRNLPPIVIERDLDAEIAQSLSSLRAREVA